MKKDFEYFKNWVITHLMKQEKEENSVCKSLLEYETELNKAFGVGTIRTWKGKKYIKGADKKWRPYYEHNSRGKKMAVAAIVRQINNLQDGDFKGLWNIIKNNKSRFVNEEGKPENEVIALYKMIKEKGAIGSGRLCKKKAKNRSQAMKGNQNAKKFSSLSDDEKKQKANEINKNIVSQIKKDSVPYNNDKRFDNSAKEWLENNPQGNANTLIGDVIINKRSVLRDMHHGADEDKYIKLQTLPAVKDVLEKGTYLGYEKDFDGNNIDNHYFAGKIKYGNEEKIIFCRVRDIAGDTNRFYVHEVFTEDEIKKELIHSSVTDGNLPLLTGKALYQYILEDVLNVKNKKSTLKKSTLGRFWLKKSIIV